MKPKSISALVYKVTDLQKTTAFYEELGFRVGKTDGQIAVVYVNWFAVEFHQSADIDDTPKDGPMMLVSVDIDEFYEAAIAAGHKPIHELQKTTNGRREFALRDPSGYTVVFFEKK